MIRVIRSDGYDQSQQIKRQGMGSTVNKVDQVNGTGARIPSSGPGQCADLFRVKTHRFGHLYKCLFCNFFRFIFFISRERGFDLSLEISMIGVIERHRASSHSRGVFDPIYGHSKDLGFLFCDL